MSTWKQFLAITKKLDEVTQKETSKRADQVKEIEDILEERERLMYELPEPSDEERTLMSEVRQYEGRIHRQLEMIFNEVKKDMRDNKKQKSRKKQYTNPYENVAGSDGMFLDSKK